MSSRLLNISASVHAKYQGRLEEFDHVERILHTVTFTKENGEEQTRDVMATDPMDAIDTVKAEFTNKPPAHTNTTNTTVFPFDIYAHRDKVEDLPEAFMRALRAAMEDKSYGNDVCASFGMLHTDKNKMYHLLIDHRDADAREVPEEKRFCFNIVSLDEDREYNENDVEYLTCTNLDEIERIIATDSVDEVAAALSRTFPKFNADGLGRLTPHSR